MTSVSVFKSTPRDEPVVEFDNLRKPLALNVDVLSGVHSGVSQRIEGKGVTIGTDAGCDVILFADPIAPRHVSIVPKSAIGSTVVVKAIDGAVLLDTGAVLEPGQWAEGQMPLDLTIEGTHVTVSRTVNPHEFARPALAVVAALALILVGPNLVDTAFSSVKQSVFTAPATSPITTGTVETADAAVGAGVIERLREQIANRELGHLVAATEGRDGTVLVSGEIGAREGSAWRSVLQWYDSVPNSPDLVNAVRVGKAPEMPAIASVWLLGDPELTLADGEKLRVGDTASGGWVIKQISAEGVVLNRNGSDVTITF